MRPWLKRGAGVFSRALLLYNRLIFTDYEERLLFLRGRCNSAWKFSAVSAHVAFGKYDNCNSAWSLLAPGACVVLHKYDNWQAVLARVVR